MKHFHGAYMEVFGRHDPNYYYPEFKVWANRYFQIPHRGETRGLGGVFFDDQNDRNADKIFDFCEDTVNSVIKAFGPIIEKHKNDKFTPTQKEWQLLRRGCCVEFSLVYDRGTIFGLKTGERIKSILMSLPKIAGWQIQFSSQGGQCRG